MLPFTNPIQNIYKRGPKGMAGKVQTNGNKY